MDEIVAEPVAYTARVHAPGRRCEEHLREMAVDHPVVGRD
eukprot:COSAG06_NODE_44213_length_365_cov_0.966165_1_plen_39_part_10